MYGNQGGFTQGRLFGDGDEANEIDHEKKVGCRQAAAEIARAAAEASGPEEKLINVAQFVRNYFPSTAKYAADTMLRLEGETGVIVKDSAYTSYFSYTLTPVGDSKGNPNVITVAPAFIGPAAILVKDYFQQNPALIKSDTKNDIRFSVKNVTNPRLVYATYDFLDDEHNIVASVDVPVFVNRGK